MEDPSPLLSLDAELLAIMLENMSFGEIQEWCNTHPRFKELCHGSASILPLIERKSREEIAGTVMFYTEDETFLFFGVTLMSDLFNMHENFILGRENMEIMINHLSNNQSFELETLAWDYTLDGPRIKDGVGVSYDYTGGANFVGILSSRCPSLSVDPLLFRSILVAALSAADKGFTDEDGKVLVFRDGGTRFKSRWPTS